MSDGWTLILSVDRDDDIGYKAGVASPVVGREACLETATALALVDPEDSDVNAIFQTIKIYDDLKREGQQVAIAVISGDHFHMIEGDRLIARSLDQVIRATGVTDCIMVTDGAEDDYVIPIIQSRLPVSSIKRVVVSQMPNLEGTYYILKKLLDDPKISRPLLVPVGLAMLLYATAYLLGYPEVAVVIVVGVIGVYLLLKGFGVDEVFGYSYHSLYESLSRGRYAVITNLVSLFLILFGILSGLTTMIVYYLTPELVGMLYLLLAFLYGAIPWFAGAGLVSTAGKILDVYLAERENLWRVVILPFVVVMLALVIYGISTYMLAVSGAPEFVLTTEAALRYLLVTIAGSLVSLVVGLSVQARLKRLAVPPADDGDVPLSPHE
ncbi:DUF373 family protein [Methanosphaerula palustris]|nr:DUF373 family protein [Methanosphaerula palustris]